MCVCVCLYIYLCIWYIVLKSYFLDSYFSIALLRYNLFTRKSTIVSVCDF
jgi:hypothetical protein